MTERIDLTADLVDFDADTRTLTLRIVPYGPTITHKGVKQRFTRVDVPDDVTIPFTSEHPTRVSDLAGKLVAHEQRDDGLYGTVKLSNTTAGNDLYTLAADGLLTDVSGGVWITTDDFDAETDTSVRTGTLDHVAATLKGAFGGTEPASRVLAVHTIDKGEPAMTDPITEPAATFDLDELQDEVRQLRQSIETFGQPPKPARRPEAWEVFAAVLKHRALQDDSGLRTLQEEYALDPTPGVSGGTGDAEGIIPADWWAGGLVDVRGGWRPFFNRLGSMPYPKFGTSMGFGRVVSGPTAAVRAAQDGDSETSPMVVEADSATIQWFDGAGRIPLELIEQSDPAVMQVFYGRLVAAVNAQIENYAVDTIVAGGTATTAVLTLSTYAALVSDLITTSEAIRAATDMPGDLLACSTSDWIELLSLVDGNDRRLFSTQGIQNADGSGLLTAQSVDIGGVTAFHAPDLAESCQFNTTAAKGTDRAPRRVQNVHVEKMGVEVGILGSAIVAPMIAGGIQYYAAALPGA